MNTPFSHKQSFQFFVLFYSLFSAFLIYSYIVKEPIHDSFLFVLPIVQMLKPFKSAEERRYFILASVFTVNVMTLTYSVGIWLGHIKPLVLILPAGFALAILYRLYFKKE
ncbi:TPA: MFS transporter [Streptococcus suis]